ncbi:MAG: hypothetical protein Tsb002_38420 [Wenzhouxiangellaceae bacterium]
MFRITTRSVLVAALVAACATAQPLFAQEGSYRVEVTSDALLFHRANTREQDFGVVLTVTGPDDFIASQQFAANQAVYFSVLNSSGQLLGDGAYNYELSRLGAERSRQQTPGHSDPEKFGSARQSGVFTIASGAISAPDVVENDGQRDQVLIDDQIIQASLCVGFDCVNGESFDFDAIRLKENNVRIRFVDTSNSASFPTTDWELVANDTTNGGANRFSIEDLTAASVPFTIEGNAPDHSLFIDDSGRVGLGTSTPAMDLHVASGNTPALRLDQDASQGFQAQTWDIAANELEFIIRDQSNVQIPFRLRPTAPSNSLYIDTSGDVGMGTGAPLSELHIQRASNGPLITLQSTGAPNRSWQSGVRDADGDFTIDDTATAADELVLRGGGNLEIAGTLTSMAPVIVPKTPNRNSLMPLDQLAAYIDRHQQLPGVDDNKATASRSSFGQPQAAGNGHDVVAFQMMLLEKIQQLTLHTIEQQERIEALEAELAKQQQK